MRPSLIKHLFPLFPVIILLFTFGIACSKGGKKEDPPPPPQSQDAAADLQRAREAAMAFGLSQRGRLGQQVDDNDTNAFDRLLVWYMILNQHKAHGRIDDRHIRNTFGPAFAEAVAAGLSPAEQRLLVARVGATVRRSPQGSGIDMNNILNIYSSLGSGQFSNLLLQ